MNIDIEKIEQLTADADKIFLSAEGEQTLVDLLKIQQQVEDAITTAKQMLERKALEINPNFSSIQADKIKVYYRSYGARYRVDQSRLDQIPGNFFKVSIRYDAVADEIEKFAKEKGGLPLGIDELDRSKTLTFSLKGEKNSE